MFSQPPSITATPAAALRGVRRIDIDDRDSLDPGSFLYLLLEGK
jgi:hypothetical protein